jgi:hypothetical protein
VDTRTQAAWSVDVVAVPSTAVIGMPVTVTAKASPTVTSTGMQIVIIGATGTACSAQVTKLSAGSATYQAEIRPTAGGAAVASDSASVTYGNDWTAGLQADTTTPFDADTVHLTATTNRDVAPTPWSIQIRDESDAVIASCDTGTQCGADVTGHQPDSHTYRALVVSGGSVAATSAGVTIQWQDLPLQPLADMVKLPTHENTASFPVSWTGTEGSWPIATYDVQVRRAAWNGTFGAFVDWRPATTNTTGTFAGLPGSTYCFTVRSRDTEGFEGRWSSEGCTSVPLDDRRLVRAPGWTAGTNSAYFAGTYLRTTTKGATLTRTGVATHRIALLVTTCSTCGSVRVYWRGEAIKTVSLYSATTVRRRLITITTLPEAEAGTLRIVVTSSGKRVIVDGVALRRN